MSDISLKLVHSRPLIGAADDLALTLLVALAGLFASFAMMSAGFELIA